MHRKTRLSWRQSIQGGVRYYGRKLLFPSKAGKESSKKKVMNLKLFSSREAWKVEFHCRRGGNTSNNTVTVGEDEED